MWGRRPKRRVFYVACMYADPIGNGWHTACNDVTVYGKLDASKMNEVTNVCADLFGVDSAKLVVIFFKELES